MKRFVRPLMLTAPIVALSACAPAAGPTPAGGAPPTASMPSFEVPVEYHTLDNGLRVVLSPDHTAPTAVVAVYYNIGFRIEPRDRTGFAHLFEHMMFQGSENLGKMEFIRLVESNGGTLNGSTRFDYTNYFQIVPSNTVEMMLWAEADRMRGLAITQEELTNQQEVVKNEVRVNVLNQPYGGFPWLDLPQYANTNWYNAHNFYGDLEDLDAATLEDVQDFFDTYYAPNNAAVVVVGDIDSEQTLAWVREYFGDISPAPLPDWPDISEPRQTEEKRFSKVDPLANRPALALGYHAPRVGTPEYYALGLLHQILGEGVDSRLHTELVQRRGYAGEVGAGINPLLGNMFNINGPTLWAVWLLHDQSVSAEQIVAAIDEVIEPLRTDLVDEATLERARVKMRSQLYDEIEAFFGFGRADMLASFALFYDEPERINELEDEFLRVTPELLLQTAQEYLRPTNRTILTIEPGAATPTGDAG